ncbi:MAG: 16S rRNA (cytosine(967)-C(5))-methyltransferase RsmB [Lachnospiraceae bacterium]|nr:16S rRNA (cytosine(967)-C(5))-methyltransferase RsmB [Lachnospiraceae bacterium]
MLIEILEKNSYSHLVIRGVLDKYNYLEGRDKAFLKRVTEGTLERLIQIDHVLNRFSKVPVSKMKPLIRNLMRLSVYQLLFMDSVPDSAVCNEAVKLAGKRGFRSLSGYVNGVLRNIARNKENIAYPDPKKDKVSYYSVKYSMPEWIVSLWIKEHGEEITEGMLAALLEEHPVTVRVSPAMTDAQKSDWLKTLAENRISYVQHPYLQDAYLLKDTEGIANLSGYEEGSFTVQDVSSMLAVEAAGIREMVQKEGTEDILVLDVCAAPGGKSLYAAQLLKEKGNVISRDLTEYKVSLIRDNIDRMKSTNVKAQVWDALIPDDRLTEKADIVLADLPCSGLGIMGKKRDIRYRSTPEKLQELAELQKQILSVVWQYVKPGGVLVYSTCTIHSGENEEIVKWFTNEYPFECESIAPYLPEALKEEGEKGYLQLLPGIHETDGFFIARLRKKQER